MVILHSLHAQPHLADNVEIMASPLLKKARRPGKAISEQRPSYYYINQPSPAVHAACGKNSQMKTQSHRRGGFTLVEIMVVVAIIALLAAIAIPNFVHARESSQRAACIANLKQIEGAKGTWAIERKKSSSDSPTDNQLFGATRYIRRKPSCPASGDYTIDLVGNPASCSLANAEGHTL